MIVLDTSVLSLAFRRTGRTRSAPVPAVIALRRMIGDDLPLAVPCMVTQELLSGVRTPAHFQRLNDVLTGFPPLVASFENHVSAARISNACRAGGVAVSAIAALIAAQTVAAGAQLFTLDVDFQRLVPHCALQ